MATEEELVREATLKFYQALDELLLSKGTEAMRAVWYHGDSVATVHPFGHWAIGWTEVWANWEESAAIFAYYRGHVGRKDGIGTVHDLRITIVGDMAYTVGVYKSVMYFPDGPRPLSVNCTDVLIRTSDGWKMAVHHADQAPTEYQEAIGDLLNQRSVA